MTTYYDEYYDCETDDDDNYEELDNNYDETKEDKELNSVHLFRVNIWKSPLFIGINNISDYELLEFIKTKKESEEKKLDDDEILLFDDLYFTLYGMIGTKKQYEYVTGSILKKIYVPENPMKTTSF
jgi:hypothetical protein